uniref:Neprosin PEP catalytic domain-containing protein n=1 Tax=Aegilops tauschii TaxID=37682 RepID=M8CT06_AEGTA
MAYFSIVAVLVLPFVCGANGLDPTSQQFAYHRLQAGESAGYYGVSVTMDVYALSLSSNQYSSAGVQISSGEDGAADQNVIKIGSEVYPHLYGGDSRTHLGAVWTTDGFQTRCGNTKCAVGFQPEAGAALVLGDIIEPLSNPNGTKQTITIKLLKDGASGDWMVHCGLNQREPTLIGRYPKSLFPGGLADRATHIHIGGVVASRTRDLVPMGSGYLPTDKAMSTSMAASFSNIQIINQNGQASLLSPNLSAYMTSADTYSVSSVINGKFFYGGPFQLTA